MPITLGAPPAPRARLVAALVVMTAWTAPAAAQQPVRAMPQRELRLELPVTPDAGLGAGVGLNVRAGWYARVGVAATLSAVRDGAGWGTAERIEATSRFLFDPFAERPRGVYAGAGVAARRGPDGTTRGDLLLLIGVEGRAAGRAVPAVELALGGGLRLGAVFRARRPAGR
jgi:hypothetical protein